MKCLSIHQPWAWAILHAGKTVENRSWSTTHRGPLLVHASKSLASYDRQNTTHWRRVLGVCLPDRASLPFGAIVGVVDVVDVVRVGAGGQVGDRGRSAWAEDGYLAWVLENPRAFAEPIPFRGAQMIFEVPNELLPAGAVQSDDPESLRVV